MESQSDHVSEDENEFKGRQKTPGITEYEKNLLLQLIEERKGILEDKRTSIQVHVKKVAAWAEVATLFNSDAQSVTRNESQLKKIWDNWKQSTKKKITQYRKAVRKTGGGPKPKELPSDTDRIASMIPEQIRSLSNRFDSDSTLEVAEGNMASVTVDQFLEKPTTTNTSLYHAENLHDLDDEESCSVENAIKKVKKPKKDPRSLLVEYECEEHKVRMRNLNLQTEIFQTELLIKKRSLQMMEEEHGKKMRILEQKEYL